MACIKVKCCKNCPFLAKDYIFGLIESCKHPFVKWTIHIDKPSSTRTDIPEHCPLKKENLTIELE